DAALPLVLLTTALEPWTAAHLQPLLEAIDLCDHAIGRRIEGSRWRTFCAWAGSIPRRLIFAVPVIDVHSPCQLPRLEKLRSIPLQPGSSFVDAEILAKATFLAHLLKEVPVPPMRGGVFRRGWWRDLKTVLKRPRFRRGDWSSVPAEHPQGNVKGSNGP